MPYGSAACQCHNCGKRWLGGCVIRFTCDDCGKLGHTDGLVDCPACEKASKDGFLAALDSIVKQRDALLAAGEGLLPFVHERGMEGETEFERAVIALETAINKAKATSGD